MQYFVRDYRKAQRYSQKELAELSGVSRVTIAHIEEGKVDPKIDTLIKIAIALNVPTSELYLP